MFRINKATQTGKNTVDIDLDKINAQSRRELTEDDVYVFSIRACDDQPDRDYERFTVDCLKGLADLFVGKTVIFDHSWSALHQTARIYDCAVLQDGNENYLLMHCYMLRSEQTLPIIDAIDAGILREVSVGCSVGAATCSICGSGYGGCEHRKGQKYGDKLCICELSDPKDAYEVSFVAVPAQPKAGVQKSAADENMSINDLDRLKKEVEIEKIRFGGNK